MTKISCSPASTKKIAGEFCKKLKAGSIVALVGDLGAGKTTFVQGMALSLGIKKRYYVNSPTFTILNVYEGGSLPLYHFDWYRLRSFEEAADIGVEEYFDSKGISVIEWAEKFPELLPKRVIWVKLEATGKNRRKIAYEL